MLATGSIMARLTAEVTDLASVKGASELAALLAAPPQVWKQPHAYVVPMGIRGGQVQSAAGIYVQAIDVSFSVYLVFPAHNDAKGARALADVAAVQSAVITALCGWVPAGQAADGDVRLARAYLAELKPGLLVYAIDFTVPDQMRIST
jgi:hypothetical protein